MRIRRTAEELAAGYTLEQVKVLRGQLAGELGPTVNELPKLKSSRLAVDPHALIAALRDAPWNLGHSEFSAQMIEYLIGERDREDVVKNHPEIKFP